MKLSGIELEDVFNKPCSLRFINSWDCEKDMSNNLKKQYLNRKVGSDD